MPHFWVTMVATIVIGAFTSVWGFYMAFRPEASRRAVAPKGAAWIAGDRPTLLFWRVSGIVLGLGGIGFAFIGLVSLFGP